MTTIEEAFHCVNEERLYGQRKWAAKREAAGLPPVNDSDRAPEDWLVFLESHMRRVEDAYSSQVGDQATLVAIRKLGGLCMSALLATYPDRSADDLLQDFRKFPEPPQAPLGVCIRQLREYWSPQHEVRHRPVLMLTAVLATLMLHGAPRREVSDG